MILHYLTIAFRNMRKHTNQTLISVIGLALGFTCFALATLWLVYEMSYDASLTNAKHKYVVYIPKSSSSTGYSRGTYYPLAAYLKATFPEIVHATPLATPTQRDKVTLEDTEYPAAYIMADSSLFGIFDIKITEGSRDFLIPNSRNLAITQEKARQLFGNENPLGKRVNSGEEICAVVSGMSKHSNYVFDFIRPVNYTNEVWNTSLYENTIIELLPGANLKAFEKKLYEHNTGEGRNNISRMIIKPLTKIRYTDPEIAREVKFQHIMVFALSGLLLVVCSLFNFLTLFVSRLRIRQKELALRMVCGASGGSLLRMLSVEFLLTVLFAVIMGCVLTQWVYGSFVSLSDVKMDLPVIYRESLLYIGGLILVSFLTFELILFIFRRRSLNLSIRQSNKKMFRKISIVVQLVISIGFAFCTVVILKQMYFLHHTDELGFAYQNRGSVELSALDSYNNVLANQLKQIPEITDVVDEGARIIPYSGTYMSVSEWDDKSFAAEKFSLSRMYVSPELVSFYNFRLISGEMLTDADADSLVLLNETAVRAFGWNDPVGKHFEGYIVKGVVKNIYNIAPTMHVNPLIYSKRPPADPNRLVGRGFDGSPIYESDREKMRLPRTTTVVFKYREGMWKSCKEKIDELLVRDYTAASRKTIYNFEEEYAKFLTSEKALFRLLTFVSAVCMSICVFGFVSLVSLACKERRKAIAIRKINGATVGDILTMFIKEYALLLLIGAAIAFPVGYFIMQRWLEQYVKQTDVEVWVYLSNIIVMALSIVLCVGWQVYKASIENPAEVINND